MVTRAAVSLFLSIGVLLAPAAARGQSPDPPFAAWTWTPEVHASEAMGLGGAYVATLRGADALYWSPAALTFSSGFDIRASLGARPALGVVHHGDRLHVGFGVRRTFSRTQRGQGFDEATQIYEVGQLWMVTDQAALGAAIHSGRLRLGASLAAGPFKASGAWSRVAAPAPGTQAVVETRYDYTDVSEWQFGAASSAIVELLGTHAMARDQARVGVAVRWPTMVRSPRYRRSRLILRQGAPDDAGSVPAFEGSGPHLQSFRLPPTVSFGGEARLSMYSMIRSIRIALGADWTDYDNVLDTARTNAVDMEPPTALESARPWTFGGGVEVVHPIVRVRVGLREREDHRLVTVPPQPPARMQTRTTFGASHDALIAGKRLQLDMDATSSFRDALLSLRILW